MFELLIAFRLPVPVVPGTENWNCWPVVERIVMFASPESVTVPDVYVVSEFAIPPRNVCVSACTDWETEKRNACPVVERIVMLPPSTDRFTVPDVYVVWEFWMPPRNVCVSG